MNRFATESEEALSLAFALANAALTTVNAALTTVNAALTTVNVARTTANAALTTMNAASTLAKQVTLAQSCASLALVNAALTTANAAFTIATQLPFPQKDSMLSNLQTSSKSIRINHLLNGASCENTASISSAPDARLLGTAVSVNHSVIPEG